MRTLAFCLGVLLCGPSAGDTTFNLSSTSERAAYGVLVVAPERGCSASRVVVRGNGGLWKSRTLAAGEVAVIRFGRGFAVGEHEMAVQTAGCKGEAVLARRVVFQKSSPDHGWRAGTIR